MLRDIPTKGKRMALFKRIEEKGEILHEDAETGVVYEAFKGAFSWPQAPLPGFLCVVGQQYHDGILKVLYEDHYENLDDVARRLGTLENFYSIKYWIADREGANKCFEDLLDDIGKSQDRTFRLTQPDLPSDFNLAIQVLRKQFYQNALVLIQDGILQDRIEQLKQAGRIERDMADKFPEIQVLANVVYEFPSVNDIVEKRKPRDAWAEDFEDTERPDNWMRW